MRFFLPCLRAALHRVTVPPETGWCNRVHNQPHIVHPAAPDEQQGFNSHPSADTANYTPPSAAALTGWGPGGGEGGGGGGVPLSNPPPNRPSPAVPYGPPPPTAWHGHCCFHGSALASRAGRLCYKKAPRLLERDTTVTTWTRPGLLPTRLLPCAASLCHLWPKVCPRLIQPWGKKHVLALFRLRQVFFSKAGSGQPVRHTLSLIADPQSAARLPHVAEHDCEPIAPSDLR